MAFVKEGATEVYEAFGFATEEDFKRVLSKVREIERNCFIKSVEINDNAIAYNQVKYVGMVMDAISEEQQLNGTPLIHQLLAFIMLHGKLLLDDFKHFQQGRMGVMKDAGVNIIGIDEAGNVSASPEALSALKDLLTKIGK